MTEDALKEYVFRMGMMYKLGNPCADFREIIIEGTSTIKGRIYKYYIKNKKYGVELEIQHNPCFSDGAEVDLLSNKDELIKLINAYEAAVLERNRSDAKSKIAGYKSDIEKLKIKIAVIERYGLKNLIGGGFRNKFIRDNCLNIKQIIRDFELNPAEPMKGNKDDN